jgi:hypothetical protein
MRMRKRRKTAIQAPHREEASVQVADSSRELSEEASLAK